MTATQVQREAMKLLSSHLTQNYVVLVGALSIHSVDSCCWVVGRRRRRRHEMYGRMCMNKLIPAAVAALLPLPWVAGCSIVWIKYSVAYFYVPRRSVTRFHRDLLVLSTNRDDLNIEGTGLTPPP